MKEYPVIFNTEMVKAILDGTKTQTRRVIKPQFILPDNAGKPYLDGNGYLSVIKDRGKFDGWYYITAGQTNHKVKCPYGQVGDRLWVRETHYRCGQWRMNGFTKTGRPKWSFDTGTFTTAFYSDAPPSVITMGREYVGWYKRSSIHMPRWASRITLEITEVRVERVQEISPPDIVAEGYDSFGIPSGAFWFKDLWDSLNAKRGYGWDANPWVWCLTFKLLGA